MSVFTAKTFEPSTIGFGTVENNKMGGKFIPLTDANGNKVRPPNALGVNDYDDGKQVYKKKYSVADVIEDIKRGYLTHRQIADLHNITSNTVSNISKRAGLTIRKGRKYVTT
jgi:hypothetical protein